MNRSLSWIPSLVGAIALMVSPLQASAVVKLAPQDVVDLALSKGRRAKSAELAAQRSYLTLQKALGVYDLQFTFIPSYEVTEAENLGMTNNLRDRTQMLQSSLAKAFSTGTNLELAFNGTQQWSTLSPTSTRSPNMALNSTQLSLRQSVWRNSFGYADRLGEVIGSDTVEAAHETRDKSLQTILLDAMTLYWNTFVAERQLKENMAAREKYELLVKTVRRKTGFNLSTPGELPRLEAELEGVEQKVKSSSVNYLNSLRSLLTAIQLETQEPVELAPPSDLPPVPKLIAKDVSDLRAVRIAGLNLENAKNALAQTKSRNRPQLDLVAKAKVTGVEDTNSASVAEMQAGTKPQYYVGIEFATPVWGSDLKRGLIADAEVALRQAEVEYKIQTEQARDDLLASERNVASLYAIAKSANATVDFRARVVRDLEAAYRQGRQPLVELIRAYNDLFAAQQAIADAIGKYHIALNQLAASRDELVASPRGKSREKR